MKRTCITSCGRAERRRILKRALKLARAGKPVFPCRPDNKAPFVDGGFHSATTDEAQIREWWKKWPDAMIGMPTGPASGVWVLDVDANKGGEGEDGYATLAKLTAKHGPLPETRIHSTPSGGRHYLFKCPTDREIRNSASKIGAHLDVRGKGGYIIVPPSLNDKGIAYKTTNKNKPAKAPKWLLDLVTPLAAPKRDRPEQQARPYHGGPLHPYVKAAVDRALDELGKR